MNVSLALFNVFTNELRSAKFGEDSHDAVNGEKESQPLGYFNFQLEHIIKSCLCPHKILTNKDAQGHFRT